MSNLHDQHPGFKEFALQAEPDGSVWLWGYGEYPASSVLAGQYRQARLENYATAEEAVMATGLRVADGERDCAALVRAEAPVCAPDWFDAADAGEAWSEEDY